MRSLAKHYSMKSVAGIFTPCCSSSRVSSRCFSSTFKTNNDWNAVREIVRKYDYSSYLCTLLLPIKAREPALAIRAFNAEIANIVDSTNQSSLASMRFAFWKDALDLIFEGKPPRHPVATCLSEVVNDNKDKISKGFLIKLLESRRLDAQKPNGFATIQELRQYSERTASTTLYLVLLGGGMGSDASMQAAGHVGRAIGFTTVLRATPFLVQKREVQSLSECDFKQDQCNVGADSEGYFGRLQGGYEGS
eukprot:m.159853 g.159853  ORF g.159853 m.159853 type:complete len:249 (+) comp15159_c0_seq12:382-1128(+)